MLGDVLRPSSRGPVSTRRNTVIPLDAFHQLEYTLAKQLAVALDDLERVPRGLPQEP